MSSLYFILRFFILRSYILYVDCLFGDCHIRNVDNDCWLFKKWTVTVDKSMPSNLWYRFWRLMRHHELPGQLKVKSQVQASALPENRWSRRWRRWTWWRRWRRGIRWWRRPFAILLTTGRCKSQLLWGQLKWMVVSSQYQSMRSASTKSIHCNDVLPEEG